MKYFGLFCFLSLTGLARAGTVEWKPEPQSTSVVWNQRDAIDWVVTCGSPQEDWINRVVESADDGILAAGFIGRDDSAKNPDWNAVALRLSPQGRLLWSRAFGGEKIDTAWALRESSNPSRVVLGGFSSSDSDGDLDAYLAFLGADGKLESEHRFGGEKNDRATDVLRTRDGGFLLVGETASMGAGERDVLVVKTNAKGEEQWKKSYGGAEMDRGFAAVETPDGGVVIIGITGTTEKQAGLVLKIAADGTRRWQTLIEGDKNVTPHFINLLPDGRVVVAGYTASWGATIHDYFAATISPEGEIEKLETLGGAEDDRAMTSATAADGGTWVIGYSKSFGARDWDILIARLRNDGSFVPEVIRIGTAQPDHGTAIAEARNGDLLIGGYTTAPSKGSAPPDLLLMRLDPGKAERLAEGVIVKTVK